MIYYKLYYNWGLGIGIFNFSIYNDTHSNFLVVYYLLNLYIYLSFIKIFITEYWGLWIEDWGLTTFFSKQIKIVFKYNVSLFYYFLFKNSLLSNLFKNLNYFLNFFINTKYLNLNR